MQMMSNEDIYTIMYNLCCIVPNKFTKQLDTIIIMLPWILNVVC